MANVRTFDARKSVAVVDDDEDIRLYFKDILQTAENFKFAGGFSTATEALTAVPRLQPDLTLIDIRLPDLNGVECVKRLKLMMPRLKIVIVSGTHEVNWVDASLQAGAITYLMKPVDGDQLLATLKFAAINQGHTEDNRLTKLAKLLLNSREKEVLKSLADGLLYKEISDKLGISYSAVHKCQHKIFIKLHVSNRSEAIRIWLDNRAS